MDYDADEQLAPRNDALSRLEELLGEWTLTTSNAWFLRESEMRGRAVFEWLGDAFIVVRSELAGEPAWDFVIGHNDPRNPYVVLYHDERGTSRVFDMTFESGRWELLRGDPDFHQRLVGDVTADRIDLSAEASEDGGRTWRKDLDLTFERRR
jgi:hypothetical protein